MSTKSIWVCCGDVDGGGNDVVNAPSVATYVAFQMKEDVGNYMFAANLYVMMITNIHADS